MRKAPLEVNYQQQIHSKYSPCPTKIVKYIYQICLRILSKLSLSDNNQADFVEAFICTSRYLVDLLKIDTHYFEQTVSQI